MQDEPNTVAETMDDVGTTLSERLKRAMARKDISQAELARRCGVRRPSVADWVSGKTKSLAGENLVKAAEALGVLPRWLATGFGPELSNARAGSGLQSEAPNGTVNSVPIYSWEQASMLMDGITVETTESVQIVGDMSAASFAIRQQGSSMEPRIPDGAIVVIDPESESAHGSIVLARRPGDLKAVLRQLWYDGGEPFLRPLNATYPTAEMPSGTRIIGRAVFIQQAL